MKKHLLFIFLIMFSFSAFSQEDTENDNAHTGWKFGGALPALSYDSDVGFRYGLLGYVFDWGDGSLYPDYLRSVYLEWSRTTKGSGINRFQYDDKAFIGSKIRFTSEIGYYIEQALDFYGFNGYQSVLHKEFFDETSPDYRSRMFYRLDRRNFRAIFDFQIPVNDNLKIYTGFSYMNFKISSVDIDKLNEGKDPAEMLPSVDTMPGLYEKYIDWGLIPQKDANGGFVSLFKAGVIYDTRNNEALPTKGLWDEAFFSLNPGFFGTNTFVQLNITHRQYFNIIDKKLSFAYRLAYSGTIYGTTPFYAMPFYYNTKELRDGFGGSKTVRGIYRDRIQAKSLAFGNAELRWRVINTKIKSADFYIALSGFADWARIITPYDVDLSLVPTEDMNLFDTNDADIYKFHLGYGGGIRFGLNENFIVAVDYGLAANEQDGDSGLYIGLGWLF